MKPLIVANWKCNPITLQEAKQLFNSIKRGLKKIKNASPAGSRRLSFGVEVVICPPFVYLATSNKQQVTGIKLGAQNCFWEKRGAYTGEISSTMLNDLGCQYVILGHSERRRYFGETDEMINKKIKAAPLAKLNPIFCIGETKNERERGQTEKILKFQIKKGLKKISRKEIKNLVVAYEPVWAIGTGNPCDVEEAQKMGLLIRKIVAKEYSISIAKNLRILYGGSINSKNARDYIKEADFQGLLVGGTSLDPKEFIKIVEMVSKA